MKKLYIAEKYLYMNDIQYLETEDKKKKLSLTIELPENRLSSFCTTLTTHMTKADEEDKLLDRIKKTLI